MKAAHATALIAAGIAAVLAVPAQSSIETRQQLEAQPRAWSSMAGMDASAILAMGNTFASGDAAGAQDPFCDTNDEVARTLGHDFGEALVDDTRVGSADTQLWGSDTMGTWTLVMTRADKTSCIVASGVGYTDTANPDLFYASAGIIG